MMREEEGYQFNPASEIKGSDYQEDLPYRVNLATPSQDPSHHPDRFDAQTSGMDSKLKEFFLPLDSPIESIENNYPSK
jgi:hypothetical protein